MGRKSTTNMTHHRSNHLAGDTGGRSQGRQLSLIVPAVVYEEERETPSEFVTVERDG
jgi:hypothetical protein